MSLNLVAAVPPTTEIGAAIPIGGPLGLIGSLVTSALSGFTLWLLVREGETPAGWAGQYVRPMAAPDPAKASSAGP